MLSPRMDRIESLLRRAERRLTVREYSLASSDARAVQQKATMIRQVVWSIKQAREALVLLPENDRRRLAATAQLKEATAAARRGDDQQALMLSKKILLSISPTSGQ